MSRTTAAAVQAIIQTKSSISLTPFIEAANALVTECCTSTDYTVADLEKIERWLSAHLYTNRDPRRSQDKVDVIGATYQGQTGLGFDSSFYGQTAMRLDYKGGLAALNERIKKGRGRTVSMTWLGTEKEEL
jgi:hypothetical protein